MEQMTIHNFKDFRGYVLENKNLHVCGYNGNSIMYQDFTERNLQREISFKNGTTAPIMNVSHTKCKLNHSSKGIYFNYKGKRLYIAKSKND